MINIYEYLLLEEVIGMNNKFKKHLRSYKNIDSNDIMDTVKRALKKSNIEYTEDGEYEVICDTNQFKDNYEKYTNTIKLLLNDDIHELFVSYYYSQDNIFIRINYN